jgi:hypothetical protein
MNRKLVVTATLVLVGGVAVAVAGSARRRGRAHAAASGNAQSEHALGMDRAMAAELAFYDAPEGSTPCESAYNALKASLDVSTQQHVTPVVLRLAPRDEFLQRCTSLPDATQRCLAPRYMSKHRAECDKAKPAADVLAPMVELKTIQDPGAAEPDEARGAPSGGSP